MVNKAIEIVREYIDEHFHGEHPEPQLFVCWQSAVLQNYKCLIATTIPWRMYFEVTYDGDRGCWYFDAYQKVENREIADA